MKNCILISMKKEEIVIKINEEAEYTEIVKELEKKLPKLKQLYKEEKNPIHIKGKILKNSEIEEINKMLLEEINVDITFDSPKELGLSGIKKVYEQNVEDSETRFFRGSLRSGQKMEFEGSLVIIGDVNSGAEVIVTDNIVVVGALRGLAHAGAKGNRKAIIAANSIECPQVRIANIVKEIEKQDIETKKQYAYIEDEKIVLEE